jgi:hypothetical protein
MYLGFHLFLPLSVIPLFTGNLAQRLMGVKPRIYARGRLRGMAMA